MTKANIQYSAKAEVSNLYERRSFYERAIINLIGCDPGDQVQAFLPVAELDDSKFIVMATKKGIINRTSLSLYSKPRKGGVYAMDIKEGDQLIQAKISNGEDSVIMATKDGKSIRFKETQVRPTGRRTKGVRGIMLSATDEVIGMLIAKREGSVLVASENGYGKRSLLDEYRIQSRGGKGVYKMKKTLLLIITILFSMYGCSYTDNYSASCSVLADCA